MQVPEQVLAARMPSGAKTVLSAMWRAAEDEPPWIPALQRELAQASGLSVRQVRHWIGYLREQGWIREEARELLGRTFAGHGLARTTPLHQRRPASSATAGDRRTRSAKREKTHRSEGDRIAADLAQIAKHARAGDSAEVILERLRKARAPCSDPAIAEVDGTVQHAGDGVVVVAPKNGEPRTYKVSKGRQLRVAEGDRVRAGEQLVVGEWHRGQGVPPRRPHGGEHEAAGQGSGRGRHRRPMEEDAGGLRRHHAHGPQDCGDGRQRRPTRRTRSGARSFRTPPFAAYRGVEANDDAALAHIHPGLRHLAVAVDQVLLDPANVNKHPPEQLEVLKGMLRTFGQRLPLITRESTGVLEAGEGRLLAGRALGWRYMAVLPCADDLLAARMFALGDNRSAELAYRDEEELAAQLLTLHDQGVDVAIIGWDGDDLGALLDERDAGAELPEPDAEEPPAVPWTQPGDLFEIGPHRLVCGDSTDPAVVERVMQGEKAALVVTDPPYGVKYVGKSEDLAAERRTIANDDLGLDATRDLVARAARAWPLRPGGVWYVCAPSGDMETAFRFGIVDAGERLRSAIAWVKNQFVLGHLDYHYQHETILYGWREGAGHFWCGTRSESSVWEIAKPSKSADHPTMKPIELLARAIGNSSVRGDIVFDGFGGSGQTLFAASGLGRRARLVELSPGFCDVIARRARELGHEVVVDRPGVGRIPWGEALTA